MRSSSLLRVFLLLSAFFGGDPGLGQEVGEPYLVRDISQSEIGSDPSPGVVFGGRALFLASALETGSEPWITDGTPDGTHFLLDIAPGRSGSHARSFLAWGERAVFSADDSQGGAGGRGRELWITDGTPAGTRPLTDIAPGIPTGDAFPVTVFADRLVVRANDGIHGNEPWITDGTPEGTYLLADLNPGAPDSAPAGLNIVGEQLVFTADDGAHGRELWMTDGTPAGTRMLADVNPGPSGSGAGDFVVAAGQLFFSADDGTHGNEPWTSDGTPAGTRMLADLEPGGFSSSPRGWTAGEGGAAFTTSITRTGFITEDGLWWTDGVQTTRLVEANLALVVPLIVTNGWIYFVIDRPGEPDARGRYELWRTRKTPGTVERLGSWAQYSLSRILVVAGRLYFTAQNEEEVTELWTHVIADGSVMRIDPLPGLSSDLLPYRDGVLFATYAERIDLRELWIHDATGAHRIASVEVPIGSFYTQPLPLALLGELLIFGFADLANGAEPWLWDGTTAYLLANLATGTVGSEFSGVVALEAGPLWFVTSDGVHGSEPWVSDGTEGGTHLLADLVPGLDSSAPGPLLALGGRVIFGAHTSDGFNVDLWASDGTLAGTRRLADVGGSLPSLIAVGSRAFFLTGSYDAVWTTDGTPGGTRPVIALPPGVVGNDGDIAFEGRYVFGLLETTENSDGDTDYRGALWITDGTPAGTQRLLDSGLPIFRSPHFVNLQGETAVAGGKLFFEVERETDEGFPSNELWVSNGTRRGTRRLAEQAPLLPPFTPSLFPFGDRLVFMTLTEPWITDGTAEGTYRLATPPGETPIGLAVTDESLFFLSYLYHPGPRFEQDAQLWVSDGTAQGTRLVRSFVGRAGFSVLGTIGNRLLFSADDGVHGLEPWVSDGTPEGTRLLADIHPGGEGSTLGLGTVNVAGSLYFIADDELWASDGSTAGTRKVVAADGSPSAVHRILAFHHGLFYLVAEDTAHGDELWALPFAGPDDTAPLGPGGRFEATITWRDFQGHEGEGTAVTLTDATGAFWFFEPSNLEVVVKVLDGRGVNGRWWVFWGSLSNVGFTLTVRDTTTGAVWSYDNPLGRFASGGDTAAF